MVVFHSASPAVPCSIAGVPVLPVTRDGLLEWIVQQALLRHPCRVLYANAYAITLAQRHAEFMATLRGAEMVFCDGYGVWWAARLLGTPLPARLTPPDWVDALAARCAAHNLRLFLLGAEPGVAAEAATCLRAVAPGLQVASWHGYFALQGPENEAVLAQLRQAAPDVLLVGMGMPRQELWIEAHHAQQPAPVVIAVGALFDYVAGRRQRGPHWLTDGGGEWLWRLLCEPRRLWRRYLLGNPAFAGLVLRQWLRQRRR